MSTRKDSTRLGLVLGGIGAAVVLTAGPVGASPPTPELVGRVPLVGLLPPWTWDPSARPAPPFTAASTSEDEAVATARRFVVGLLSRQNETARNVSGYRLDDPQLVAVVADFDDPARSSVAFTVRLTAAADGTYEADLVLEDR